MTNDERIDRIEKMLEQVILRIQSMEHEINQLFLHVEQTARQEEESNLRLVKKISYTDRRDS